MGQARIVLFYCFAPVPDPEAVRLWQLELCSRLGLRGRVIIAPHGINATVGGDLDACRDYLKATRGYEPFRQFDVSWSKGSGLDGSGASLDFPRMSVKTRPELVAFGVPGLAVDGDGVVGGGTRLTPEEVDALADSRDDVVFFDGRNRVEAAIGRFEGAVVGRVDNTHDFVRDLDSGRYDSMKGSPVITYCTGGVRCEVLSALLRERGFEHVYQLGGGIVRYLERFGSTSRWKGSLAVFDGREVLTPEGADDIGTCHRCGAPASLLRNCHDPSCRVRLVTCAQCSDEKVGCVEHQPADPTGSYGK